MDYQQFGQFELRRKFWKLVGASITITDPGSQREIGFIKMKAWKLREDIRLFTGSDQQQEVLSIKARQIIDFGATYDVTDSTSNQLWFSLRRKGLKSTFVRDHWLLLDNNGNEFGFVQETSSSLALARRWLGFIPYVGAIAELVLAFAPQVYSLNFGTEQQPAPVATLTHRKNPFIVKMNVALDPNGPKTDHRIPLAMAALLMIIDASKSS